MTADSPLKLDERTEQLLRRISEVIEMPEMMQGIAAYALERDIRTRIRELVEEARIAEARRRPLSRSEKIGGHER